MKRISYHHISTKSFPSFSVGKANQYQRYIFPVLFDLWNLADESSSSSLILKRFIYPLKFFQKQ